MLVSTHLSISIVTGFLPVLFIRILRSLMNSELLNLVVIKFYFSFFYSFIVVPYDYLYLVPASLSFMLFIAVSSLRYDRYRQSVV